MAKWLSQVLSALSGRAAKPRTAGPRAGSTSESGYAESFMNPVKLLASRNILVGVGIVAALFVALVVLQTRTGSTETMPSAERFAAPPEPTGEVVPLETVLAAFQRNRTNALRRYRQSPMSARVDAVQPVGKAGWASSVTLDGGRAVAYF